MQKFVQPHTNVERGQKAVGQVTLRFNSAARRWAWRLRTRPSRLAGSGHQGAPEFTATSRSCLVWVRGILGKEGRDFVKRNPSKVIRLSLCFPVMMGRRFCFLHTRPSTICPSGGPVEVVLVCPGSSSVLSRVAWTIGLLLPPACPPAPLPALPAARTF